MWSAVNLFLLAVLTEAPFRINNFVASTCPRKAAKCKWVCPPPHRHTDDFFSNSLRRNSFIFFNVLLISLDRRFSFFYVFYVFYVLRLSLFVQKVLWEEIHTQSFYRWCWIVRNSNLSLSRPSLFVYGGGHYFEYDSYWRFFMHFFILLMRFSYRIIRLGFKMESIRYCVNESRLRCKTLKRVNRVCRNYTVTVY